MGRLVQQQAAFGPVGNFPPQEAEAAYYAALTQQAMAASTSRN
jgi:hypothetical protein